MRERVLLRKLLASYGELAASTFKAQIVLYRVDPCAPRSCSLQGKQRNHPRETSNRVWSTLPSKANHPYPERLLGWTCGFDMHGSESQTRLRNAEYRVRSST